MALVILVFLESTWTPLPPPPQRDFSAREEKVKPIRFTEASVYGCTE